MTLRIISAQQIEYEGNVKSITLPGANGQFMVLENHATLISTLKAGVIQYISTEGELKECRIEGGIADIKCNVVSVCVY